MTKRKIKKKNIIISLCFVIFLVILFLSVHFILINKSKDSKIIGTWTTDGNTIYEFKKGGIGTLILPLSKYKFAYEIEEDKISIDFENNELIDSEYTFSFDNNRLILKGSRGTFTFTKKD